jgi:hypothetical protein
MKNLDGIAGNGDISQWKGEKMKSVRQKIAFSRDEVRYFFAPRMIFLKCLQSFSFPSNDQCGMTYERI